MMATRLAEIAHIDASALSDLGATGASRRTTQARPVAGRGQGPSSVRQAIRLLLHKPVLVEHFEQVSIPQNLDLPGLALLRQLVEFIGKNPHISCGGIVEHWREEEAGVHLARLAAQPLVIPDDGLEDEFRDVLSKLASQHQEQLVDGLLAKAHLGDLTDEEKQQLQQALASKEKFED
jgi:DNA primase